MREKWTKRKISAATPARFIHNTERRHGISSKDLSLVVAAPQSQVSKTSQAI